ncbi:MAG: tat (twin-arginine translocation) pathway signal sequence [Gammaproteobacteria bacterium]
MSNAPQGNEITRRGFLASGASLYGFLWAGSTALLALAPTRSWALELGHLDARSARVLLTLTRHIYPHPTLDDAVYALVVKDLDTAAADADTRTLLASGIAALDAQASGDWLALGDAQRLALVEAIADGTFFAKVRSTAMVSLYNNQLAFAHFGYEGPAFAQGGYLHRGFDDLTWLPDPPGSASPAP